MSRAGHQKLLWLLPCLGMTAAHAQISGWLDFNGQIKGEATDKDHIGWIAIQGFGLAGQLIPGQAGAFSFLRSPDRATPALFVASANDTVYPKAQLDLNQVTTNGSTRFVRLELENVVITAGQTTGAPATASLAEVVSLACGRITYTYFIPNAGTVYSNFDYTALTGAAGSGTLADTDGDGMPDSWETAYGFRLGFNEGDADADGDGLSNLNEYLLATDPRSGSSSFKAQLAPLAGDPSTYQLSWNSVVGKTYVVEWSPDLKTPFTTLLDRKSVV